MILSKDDWKKIFIGVSIAVIPIVFAIIGSAVYSNGVRDTKWIQLEEDVDNKVGNSVLLEYMNLQHLRFEFNEKRLDEHMQTDTKQQEANVRYHNALEQRVNRIESMYLSKSSRNEKKK